MISLKSPSDIDKIKIACRITAETLVEIISHVEVGISTLELDKIVFDLIKKKGAYPSFLNYRGFPGSACISIDEEVLHGVPGPRKVKEGDLVGIDVGVVLEGFYGDAAVTIPVGDVSPEKKHLMDTTLLALSKGVEAASAGNRVTDISNTIQKTANKYSPTRDFGGHGVGFAVHEDPMIPNFGEPGMGPILENGMVLAIEPMINMGTHEIQRKEDGWTITTKDLKPSAHFEHTVAIIDGKAQILTKI